MLALGRNLGEAFLTKVTVFFDRLSAVISGVDSKDDFAARVLAAVNLEGRLRANDLNFHGHIRVDLTNIRRLILLHGRRTLGPRHLLRRALLVVLLLRLLLLGHGHVWPLLVLLGLGLLLLPRAVARHHGHLREALH